MAGEALCKFTKRDYQGHVRRCKFTVRQYRKKEAEDAQRKPNHATGNTLPHHVRSIAFGETVAGDDAGRNRGSSPARNDRESEESRMPFGLSRMRVHSEYGLEEVKRMEETPRIWFEWCSNCENPIGAGEPYAALTCSQRVFDTKTGESIRVLASFVVGTLCRTCGEQCYLTSPDIPVGTKLKAVTKLVDNVQSHVWMLPTLPQFSFIPSQEPLGVFGGTCHFCGQELPVLGPWMEASVSYEHYTPRTGEDYDVYVLDEATFGCMCHACCLLMPFPMLQKGDDYDQAYRWFAAFVSLLQETDSRPSVH
jgi:hypothetical protein